MSRIKGRIKLVINQLGYELIRIPKNDARGTGPAYDIVRPMATYSPWTSIAITPVP